MEVFLSTDERKKRAFRLDPRTKLLIMVMVSSVMFEYDITIFFFGLAVVPLVLLVNNQQYKLSVIYCGLFLLAVYTYTLQNAVQVNQIANALFVLLSSLVLRLFPMFMMGAYIVTSTTVSEFVASMERMHVSKVIVIPLCVMFRFLPTIREESVSIKHAMCIRDIQFGTKRFWVNPLSFLEYRIIPLITSVVKIGDELSAAALTRGLGSPVPRTSIAKIGFGLFDVVFLIITMILFIGLLF